jgi:hypothetical protein
MAGKTATVIVRVETSLDAEAIRLLTEIRDRLPVPDGGGQPGHRLDRERRAAKREALAAALNALDGWVRSARDEHYTREHRGEGRGEECWRQFAPSDIRDMINNAALEVGLTPFPPPALPLEDQP